MVREDSGKAVKGNNGSVRPRKGNKGSVRPRKSSDLVEFEQRRVRPLAELLEDVPVPEGRCFRSPGRGSLQSGFLERSLQRKNERTVCKSKIH